MFMFIPTRFVKAKTFSFYRVQKVDKASFWLGEIIFLLWNSINDPLFGYLSDVDLVFENAKKYHAEDLILRRLKSIRIYGPLLCISFFLFWTPVLPIWSHFVIGICLYDSFLTVMDLNMNSLLADISSSMEERTALSKSRSLGNIFASISVFISYAVWDQSSLQYFKVAHRHHPGIMILLDFLFMHLNYIRCWFLRNFFNTHQPIRAQIINIRDYFAAFIISQLNHQNAFAQSSCYRRSSFVSLSVVFNEEFSVFRHDEPYPSLSLSLQFKFHAAFCCKWIFVKTKIKKISHCF
jgi:hypothetical protein